MGLEPTNLLHAMQALYQLSYAPDETAKLSAGPPAIGRYARPRERRSSGVSLLRRDGERDRVQVAGPLGGGPRFLDSESHGAPCRGPARRRRSSGPFRPR